MTWGALKSTAAIVVDGVEVRGFESYDVKVSMTRIPGTFTLRLSFDRAAWDLCQEDQPCQVLINGVAVLNGYIDDSDCSEDGSTIEITGRCKTSRLEESAPTISFDGLGIKELATFLVQPFFQTATLSNARNRNLVRGKGRKARAGSEPIKINTRVGTHLEPGQSRLTALDRLCEQAGYLIFPSGDGRELVIGKPNYEQEIQYRFYRPAPGSGRAQDSTVLGMRVRRSTGDRFSRVIVVGAGKGTEVNYGASVSRRFGEAKNNPDTLDGEGRDFSAPKRLVLVRSIKSTADAEDIADQEMARRDAMGYPIEVRCAGHGQVIAGKYETVFAIDTLASVHDEITGTNGIFAIVDCHYTSGRGDGEETIMTVVRRGTELAR